MLKGGKKSANMANSAGTYQSFQEEQEILLRGLNSNNPNGMDPN